MSAEIDAPEGAEADFWEEDGHRDVYRQIGMVETGRDIMHCPLIYVTARQYRNGRLEDVHVDLDDGQRAPLTANQARDLAFLLFDAANHVDAWNGVDNNPELLHTPVPIDLPDWARSPRQDDE